jgi:hypothetical protein
MSLGRIAVTGLTKAAKSAGNYLGRKSLKVVARANRTADKAYNATANLVRKAARASGAVDNAVLGPIGKATRNTSAAVIKATRHTRPRARETMGQINRRKGIVNKVHYPSQMDEHVKDKRNMDRALEVWKGQGMGKIGNVPSNANRMSVGKTPRNMNMREIPEYRHNNAYDSIKSYNDSTPMPKLERNFRSSVKSSGPRYTSKQVRAGKKVVLGATAGYAASEYYKAKKSNR